MTQEQLDYREPDALDPDYGYLVFLVIGILVVVSPGLALPAIAILDWLHYGVMDFEPILCGVVCSAVNALVFWLVLLCGKAAQKRGD